jgi:hypothetical protein
VCSSAVCVGLCVSCVCWDSWRRGRRSKFRVQSSECKVKCKVFELVQELEFGRYLPWVRVKCFEKRDYISRDE